jgi:hypothetical protein
MDAAVLLCARCEYDLRTLDPGGVCPECATPISVSVVAAADPLRAVRRPIRRAALVMMVAVGLRVIFAIALTVFHLEQGRPRFIPYALTAALDPWPINEVLGTIYQIPRSSLAISVLMWWIVLAFSIQCVGTWLITSRGVALSSTPRTLRWAARWSMALIVSMGAIVTWRYTRDLIGLLPYFISSIGAFIGPPLLLALWTMVLRAAVLRAIDRPRGLAVGWIAILSTLAASILRFVRDELYTFVSWTSAAASGTAFLLLGWLWFDLWRLTARHPTQPPAATMP